MEENPNAPALTGRGRRRRRVRRRAGPSRSGKRSPPPELRDESLALVRSLGPAALARPGRHPQVGDVTVRDILHEWVHDRDHLAQLTALTQRLVWPGMGNARRFSEPDA
jgi:hypothetical protein